MKNSKNIVLVLIVVAIVVLVLLKYVIKFPCYSREFVENYVSKYTDNFTYLDSQSYSIGINGFTESSDTDWYFHDNDLDFDFHVKTLRSNYPPKGKHIASNYYVDYFEKLFDVKGEEIKEMVTNTLSLLFDVTEYSIYYLTETYQIRINVDGKKKKNYTRVGYIALEEEVSRNLCKIIEDFDPKFKSRSKLVGWDVGLDTEWTQGELRISMYDLFFSINDYYNNN